MGSRLPHAVPLDVAARLVAHSRVSLLREIAAGRLGASKPPWYTKTPDGRTLRRTRWMITLPALAAWLDRACNRAPTDPAFSNALRAAWIWPEVLSVHTVAFCAGVSERYIRQEIEGGRLRAFKQLKHVRAGTKIRRYERWLVPESALLEWLDRKCEAWLRASPRERQRRRVAGWASAGAAPGRQWGDRPRGPRHAGGGVKEAARASRRPGRRRRRGLGVIGELPESAR